jgi:hypothetical protein
MEIYLIKVSSKIMDNTEKTTLEKQGYFHIADLNCYAKWKNVPSNYLSIRALYIGKVKIASYCMDGLNSKQDNKKYTVDSRLPTIKNHLGRFETEEECQEMCMKVARVFCKQLQDL